MPPEPQITLPSPWGAAVVIGLARVILQPVATAHRGRVAILQGDSEGDFIASQRCLINLAHQYGVDLFGGTAYIGLVLRRGLVGHARVTDCRRLGSPGCPYRFQHHQNMGHMSPPWPYAWSLAEPQLVDGEARNRPAPPHPPASQPVLFAGE